MASVPLIDHIRRFATFDDASTSTLSHFVETRALSLRAHLFQANDTTGPLAFVESGLLRLYSVDDQAKERTLQFALEGWWLADWDAFEGGGPTKFYMQAVETSRVALIRRENYEPLLKALPFLERYFRRVYQRANGAAQRRLYLNETTGAEEMYRQFVGQYPDFVQRVPQYMLASFLGFTPEFLSRIRARR